MNKRWMAVVLMVGLGAAMPAGADWLVTQDGQRIETRGPWQVKGKTVVFTDVRGTLKSLRTDDLDLDASRAATDEAMQEAPAVEDPGDAVEDVQSVMTLTNDDVGSGSGGAAGVDLLITRLRDAHARGDRAALLRLVRWQGVSPAVRDAVERTIDDLLARSIASVRSVEATSDETAPQEIDGVVYRTNLPVRAKLEVRLEPTEAERASGTTGMSTSFLLGESLGVWTIVAAVADP